MTLLFELSEQWQPEGRQKIITVLTTYINYLDYVAQYFPYQECIDYMAKYFPYQECNIMWHNFLYTRSVM